MQVLDILSKITPTSVGVKLCIIYTRLCKWTVIVYIYTVTVHCVNHFFYFIFSLPYQTTSLPQPLQQPARQNQLKINQTHLLKINQNQPSINWKLIQNQQKINPNTSTQTNLHRDTLAKKKKKTQRDRSLSEQSVLDWNDRSSWVSLDRSSWVWVLPDRCLWIGVIEIGACLIGAVDRCLTGTIGARGYGSCLIGACGSKLWRSVLAWSKLWIGACDRDGVD